MRLIWDPVDAPDLAGYLVFRAEKDGGAATVTKEPVDRSLLHRRDRRARESAIATPCAPSTEAGNASAPSPEAVAEPF